MQFTGLKDKNGKEIYEGDILSGQHKNGGSPMKVIYNEDEGTWYCSSLYSDSAWWLYRCTDGEIIGNIYEDQELLNEEEENRQF